MFCTRCGQNVPEGNRFCQGCGQEVGLAAPAAQNAPASPLVGNVSKPASYAGFWLRFVAYFIDGLILAIPFWIVVIVALSMFGGLAVLARVHGVNDPRVALALLAPLFFGFMIAWLILMVVQWLYFAGMESSGRQATFGKLAMSLRVSDLEGQRMSFGKASGRFFAKFLLALVPFGIFTYVLAGFTEKKQALHDMIAGTLVVRRS